MDQTKRHQPHRALCDKQHEHTEACATEGDPKLEHDEPEGPVHEEPDGDEPEKPANGLRPKAPRGLAPRLRPDAPDPGDAQRSLRPKATASSGLALAWRTPFKADIVDTPGPMQRAFPKARTLKLKGTFIDTSVNLNRWGVPASELASIAGQLQSGRVQLRLDHGEEVAKVVGMYDGGILLDKDDNPIGLDASDADLARAARVDFTARMTTEDSAIMIPVVQGFVEGVSPNVIAEHVECGVCGKAAFPMPTCSHFDTPEDPGWLKLRGVHVKEGSIVATPAYEDRTSFLPIGFAAGLTEKAQEIRTMAEKEAAAAAAQAGTESVAGLRAAVEAQGKTIEAQSALLKEFSATVAEMRAAKAAAKGAEGDGNAKKLKAAKAAAEPEGEPEDDVEAEGEAPAKKAEAKADGKPAKPLSLDEKLAATRQGAKVGEGEGGKAPSMPRPWGAMSGARQGGDPTQAEFRAWDELCQVEFEPGARPLGRYFKGSMEAFAQTAPKGRFTGQAKPGA